MTFEITALVIMASTQGWILFVLGPLFALDMPALQSLTIRQVDSQ